MPSLVHSVSLLIKNVCNKQLKLRRGKNKELIAWRLNEKLLFSKGSYIHPKLGLSLIIKRSEQITASETASVASLWLTQPFGNKQLYRQKWPKKKVDSLKLCEKSWVSYLVHGKIQEGRDSFVCPLVRDFFKNYSPVSLDQWHKEIWKNLWKFCYGFCDEVENDHLLK